VTISNSELFSNCETGVNPGIQKLKAALGVFLEEEVRTCLLASMSLINAPLHSTSLFTSIVYGMYPHDAQQEKLS
jgi:hypothetical protein